MGGHPGRVAADKGGEAELATVRRQQQVVMACSDGDRLGNRERSGCHLTRAGERDDVDGCLADNRRTDPRNVDDGHATCRGADFQRVGATAAKVHVDVDPAAAVERSGDGDRVVRGTIGEVERANQIQRLRSAAGKTLASVERERGVLPDLQNLPSRQAICRKRPGDVPERQRADGAACEMRKAVHFAEVGSVEGQVPRVLG